MSETIRIKNNGLKITDIVDVEKDGYGVLDDAFRLKDEEIENSTILYNKGMLQRGMGVEIDEQFITLFQNLPTGKEDINYFYNKLKLILSKLGETEFYYDDELSSIEQIDNYIQYAIEVSEDAIIRMENMVASGECDTIEIFGVMNPISIGKNAFREIDGQLDNFANYLHRLQNQDYYYAAPLLFQKEDGEVCGIYVLTEDVLSVLPTKPTIYNSEIFVSRYDIASNFENDDVIQVSYRAFLEVVNKDNIYDDRCFFVNLSKEQILEVARLAKKLEEEMTPEQLEEKHPNIMDGLPEDWVVFMQGIDDKPALTNMNKALISDEVPSDYDIRIQFSVYYKNPTEDGLCYPEEYDTINQIDTEVYEVFRNNNTIYVGRMSWNGRMNFFAYAKDNNNLEKIEQLLFKVLEEKFAGYKGQIWFDKDENWDCYFHTLYPNVYIQQKLSNDRVVEALEEAGDLIDRERIIDHFTFFKEETNANNFAKEIIQKGYEISNIDYIDEEEMYVVSFSKLAIPQEIDVETFELMDTAEQFGGDYDGWESLLVKE